METFKGKTLDTTVYDELSPIDDALVRLLDAAAKWCETCRDVHRASQPHIGELPEEFIQRKGES